MASPLHYAVEFECPDIVELLINHGANANEMNNQNRIPLHYSTQYGHFKNSKCLINHGADIQAKDKKAILLFFYGHHSILQLHGAFNVLLNF